MDPLFCFVFCIFLLLCNLYYCVNYCVFCYCNVGAKKNLILLLYFPWVSLLFNLFYDLCMIVASLYKKAVVNPYNLTLQQLNPDSPHPVYECSINTSKNGDREYRSKIFEEEREWRLLSLLYQKRN